MRSRLISLRAARSYPGPGKGGAVRTIREQAPMQDGGPPVRRTPVCTALGAYFFLRAPALLAARKEIPARMAFC